METVQQARERANDAAEQAAVLTAGLDEDGRADQDDDPDAMTRGLEALAAAAEALDAARRANRKDSHAIDSGYGDAARAQADRAERALARVKERLGIESKLKQDIARMRTMRIVLGVTVIDTDAKAGDHTADITMMQRAVGAILPHPDDAIHTGHDNERVTVIMTDWEVTS